VIAVLKMVAGARRRRWPTLAAFAAAATLLLVVWLRVVDRGGPGGPVVRDREPAPFAAVIILTPDSLATLPLTFTWHGVSSATAYRVSLTSTTGDLIWSGATSDTAIGVPDSVSLAAGHAYFYYVDALLADGTSGTSGVREVRVRP
jgi:hypothetical protein